MGVTVKDSAFVLPPPGATWGVAVGLTCGWAGFEPFEGLPDFGASAFAL